MIQVIDSKNCNNDLVLLTQDSDFCNLIVSANEIVLFKFGDKVIINKYDNHPGRSSFLSSDEAVTAEKFSELFEYNKTYLNFRYSVHGGYGFQKKYFFKGTEKALYLNSSLAIDKRNTEEIVSELTREQVEEKFNKDAYDSIYVLDINGGRVLLANNQQDGLVVDRNIIPDDETIIDMELRDRISDYNIARAINDSLSTTENYKEAHRKKTIDEIKSFKLYGTILFDNYSNMLLTSKNGQFSLEWFKLYLVEKDRFKLVTSPVAIIEPSVDDVLEYASSHEIKGVDTPLSETDFIKEAMARAEETETLEVDNKKAKRAKKLQKIKKFFNSFK